MIFVAITLLVWVLYAFIMKRSLGNEFRMANTLIPLILVCLIATICLGVNYVASAIPSVNDGIGIHNFFAKLVIGEGNWSVELFKAYFDSSIVASLLLTFIYSILALLKK